MRIKAPFSGYGSKSKIAHLYPKPQHNLIIEPFCLTGSYSWLHRKDHEVWLNDLDSRTFSMWKFLTSPDASDIVREYVPDHVDVGTRISTLIPAEFTGLQELCRAEANQGTQGAKGVHDQVTSMGAKCWKVRRKLLEVIPEVRNWKVTNHPYEALMNVEATWFVDPPYIGAAGHRYRLGSSQIDYEHLGWWCLNRRGQVIVAEGEGADWLEFQPFEHPRVQIRSRYQKSSAKEVMFHRTSATGASQVCPSEPIDNSETKMATSSPSTETESQ